MPIVQIALHLLRVASETLFLFELNKTLGALVHGGRRAAKRAYIAAERQLLSHCNTPKRHITVGLPDGTTLHTLIAGDGDGIAIILLHGHSMCSALFFAQLQTLCEAGYQVYAPDLPGWGRSSRPKFNGGPEQAVEYYMKRVLAWIDALTLNRFAIVGHSLGAYLAHEIAIARPKSVLSLTLAAPAAAIRPVNYAAAAWFCFTPQRFGAHGGLIAACLFALGYPSGNCYKRGGIREIIYAAYRLGDGTGDAAAAAMLRVCHAKFVAECAKPLVERVVKLDCPVTIVAGDQDVLVSTEAIQCLAKVMRECGNLVSVEIINGADHSPQISKADCFSAILRHAVKFKV